MSLIRRKERRQWAPEPFVPPFPGASWFGDDVNNMQAMQSSAVWACVSLLSKTVSMMPLQAYTVRGGIRVPTDVTPALLKAPAQGMTMLDWVYSVMVSLLLRGNAYGRVVRRDGRLYPTQIELLNPDSVVVRLDQGVLTYEVNGVKLPKEDVFHVRAYTFPGLAVGLSPIQYAAWTINRDRAIQQFSLGYFLDAPNPKSVLSSDQPINQEDAKIVKERASAAIQGRDLLVLGAGLKFSPLSIAPNESQFLETQKYGTAEICRFFGVPPTKVAAADVGSSMTYASVEADSLNFLVYAVQWWLSLLEDAMAPLWPGNQHVRFDTSVLLRTDIETQMKATAIAIASKQMTPDEARAMRDAPPLTEAQKAQLALIPMDVGPTGTPKLIATPTAQDPGSTTNEGV